MANGEHLAALAEDEELACTVLAGIADKVGAETMGAALASMSDTDRRWATKLINAGRKLR